MYDVEMQITEFHVQRLGPRKPVPEVTHYHIIGGESCLSRQITELKDEIKRLQLDLVLMAKLAADLPQFSNPIVVYGAKKLRDRILKGEL